LGEPARKQAHCGCRECSAASSYSAASPVPGFPQAFGSYSTAQQVLDHHSCGASSCWCCRPPRQHPLLLFSTTRVGRLVWRPTMTCKTWPTFNPRGPRAAAPQIPQPQGVDVRRREDSAASSLGVRNRQFFQAKIIQRRFSNRPRGENNPLGSFGHRDFLRLRLVVRACQGSPARFEARLRSRGVSGSPVASSRTHIT
jgi:hypothetical protein